MKRQSGIAFALVLFGAATVFGQSLPSAAPLDGLNLLQRVAQHYLDAKSYRIEGVEEQTFENEYERSWHKTVFLAAEASGNRYRYEGHSSEGGGLRVADGKTVWTYHIIDHRYTRRPVSENTAQPKIIPMQEMPLMTAERLRKELGDLPRHLNSATRLKDVTLSINGHEIPCYVVRIQTTDMKRVQRDFKFEKTLLIDKVHETIVRTVEHAHVYPMMEGGARVPMEEVTTTSFSAVELDATVPDSYFIFVPPADAKLVQEFPHPTKMGPDLSGEQAPLLKFKAADGQLVSLDSFRGKPLLLDIWATWCAPCVESLEHIARIYADVKDKGLVVVSVDQDEEARTATDFLAKKNYNWLNFHDDGDISKQLGPSGIPRTLLIDDKGMIVYDSGMATEDELRGQIAKLGTAYRAIAPKQQPAPCPAP